MWFLVWPLPDMLIFPSSDVLSIILEGQSSTPCRWIGTGYRQSISSSSCPCPLVPAKTTGICMPSSFPGYHFWHLHLVARTLLIVKRLVQKCKDAPKVTSLRFETFLFFETSIRDWLSLSWLLHVHTTNPRCPFMSTAGRYSCNGVSKRRTILWNFDERTRNRSLIKEENDFSFHTRAPILDDPL